MIFCVIYPMYKMTHGDDEDPTRLVLGRYGKLKPDQLKETLLRSPMTCSGHSIARLCTTS
jgi:hypothetical protein